MSAYTDSQLGYVYEKLGDIPMEKRRELMDYYVSHGRRALRLKYDMSNQAASHLIFHYKHWIEQIEDEHFAKGGI